MFFEKKDRMALKFYNHRPKRWADLRHISLQKYTPVQYYMTILRYARLTEKV